MIPIVPISIVVPTLNRGNDVLSLVLQIERLNPQPSEVIIVDQTDAYPKDIKHKIETSIQEATANILYVKSTIKSAGAARNLGVKMTTQDFIIFIDDDVILKSDFCGNYDLAIRENPNIDGLAGRVEGIKQKISYELPKEYKDKNVGILFRPMNYGYRINGLADLGSCNMGIKKSVFLSLNGFDETMKRLEDSDLSLRFHKNNFHSIYIPSIYLVHKLTPTGANRGITIQSKYPSYLYWQEYFYLIMKNCGLIRGRVFLIYYIKGSLWFKPLVLKPWDFISAIFQVIKGACKAKIKLLKAS